MESTAVPTGSTPALPRLLRAPLNLIPRVAHNTALVAVLNRTFAAALRRQELEFLRARVLRIRVLDANLTFCITLGNGRLLSCHDWRQPDLSIEGSLYDFLLLATRREDPDTLFFNRRLRLGGDTELGLYVKNFLAALEPEPAQEPALRLLDRVVGLMERFA